MQDHLQKVVVIQDGSEPVHCSAIRWALHGLMLKPGDSLTLLGVLQAQTMPSSSGGRFCKRSYLSLLPGLAGNYAYIRPIFYPEVGFMSRMDCGVNQRIVSIGAARKKEYENNAEVREILKLYEAKKVEFRIEVVAGPATKEVAVKSAEALKPTWIILDRMKQDKSIKLLREPKAAKLDKFSKEKPRVSCVTYDEMMPGSPEDDSLFSIELSPTYLAKYDALSQKQVRTHSRNITYRNRGLQAEEIVGNLICSYCNNRRPNPVWRRNFTYAELHLATDGFSMENNVSRGEVRYAYKGQLEMKINVVVKQAKPAYSQEEANLVSRIRHENLVMLLGSCQEGDRGLLLVYEYACNGSLRKHLSNRHPTPLSWTQRIRIALGAARGLNYQHQNGIMQGDISSSNILLNHDFEPLLGGSWLSRMQSYQHSESENVQKLESDLYSFGVVLQELITGQAVEKTLGSKDLVKSAIPLLNERRYLKLVDPRIEDSHDIHQLYRVAQLAQKLLRKNHKKKLSMDEVISTLETIAANKPNGENEDFPPMIKSNFPSKIEKQHEQEKRLFAWDINSPFSIPPHMKRNSGDFSSGGGEGKRVNSIRRRSRGAIQIHYGEMLN